MRLLAVDVGLRLGLAWYAGDGRLTACQSRHVASAGLLRRRAGVLLRSEPGLTHLALEGGGPLAEIWEREAAKVGLPVLQIPAERWRERLLYAREQRHGEDAKRHAQAMARRVLAWSGVSGCTSLRHDAAEAILTGLWAVLELGWLPELPPEVARR